jgi:hypothetical protein
LYYDASNCEITYNKLLNLPSAPAFFAYSTTSQSFAYDWLTAVFGSVSFNVGNGYSTSTNTFTVPTGWSGYYNFNASLYLKNGDFTSFYGIAEFKVLASGSPFSCTIGSGSGVFRHITTDGSNTRLLINGSAIFKLNQGDQVSVPVIFVGGAGNGLQPNFISQFTNYATYFQGNYMYSYS